MAAYQQWSAHVRGMANYTVLSSFAAVFELSLLYFLASIVGVNYLAAVIIAYILANSLQFLLIKHFTFNNKSKDFQSQVPTFVAINVGGLAITVAIVYCLVEFMAVWYLAARVISLFIVLFYSYNMHRTFTFRN